MIVVEGYELHCSYCKKPSKHIPIKQKYIKTIKDIEKSIYSKNRKVCWVRGELVPSRTGST